ncbi:calcium-binding protein [Ramlibacter sp. 2FC]|uniref:calcium-binding protein n=1 Tax=Ramlibacter sp. 2FC TaxID=2502188 RepID=UPI0010F77B46|nr:calcium-binding protein [Ramlibacter sp. 2FC]
MELVGASGNILFDHNADGIKTGTGWAGADDGILVRDLDSNGSIDSGRELFGVDTVKSNGALATHGFDALADLDSNADGFVNSSDTAYGELRIWQDANQDGISQAGELKTLAELGITSIGVTGSATGPQAGQVINNNAVALSTTYTGDGESRTVGAIDLESNDFYTEFPAELVDENGNPVAITEQAQGLPQMSGSGMARNMRAAASLDGEFATALAGFAAASTRSEQLAQLDGLITLWGKTSTYWSTLGESLGGTFTLHLPSDGSGSGWSSVEGPEGDGSYLMPVTPEAAEYLNMIAVLEVFNGSRFYSNGQGEGAQAQISPFVVGQDVEYNGVVGRHYHITVPAQQLALLEQAYDALRQSVYDALVPQTRLKPYLDAIALNIDESGIAFDTTAVGALLESARSADASTAFADLVELNQLCYQTLSSVGFDAFGLLRGWASELLPESPIWAELATLNVHVNSNQAGTSAHDTYILDGVNDTVEAGDGNDRIFGGGGNDVLMGGLGDDVIDGSSGNDELAGEYVNSFQGWFAGGGNDTYLFGRGDGQDIVYDTDTTVGNVDTLMFKSGVAPSDILMSRLGDSLVLKIAGTTDQVTLHNYLQSDGASSWAIEQIGFADGTVWDVATVKAKLLTGGDGNDAILGYASADSITGGLGNDNLQGAGGDDLVDGGDGDDAVYGDGGKDTLLGGSGNDQIMGGAGDDTMDGGAGNDTLSGEYHNTFQGWYGGAGNDTYLFGRGDGQDTIYDLDGTAGNLDTIVFKTGVSPGDVQVSHSGNDLLFKIAGTTDQLTVRNHFADDTAGAWAIEGIRFADDTATTWSMTDVRTMALTGGAGDDLIHGFASDDLLSGNDGMDMLYGDGGNDVIAGGAGSDALWGEAGNDQLDGADGADYMHGGTGDDTFDGGSGNDVMIGDYYDAYWNTYSGIGNDTYLFGRGDGQDTIYENDTAVGNLDKLIFKAGVMPGDVVASRSGNDLILQVNGTTDQITVSNYFLNESTGDWFVEEVRFTDAPATVWRSAEIKNLVLLSGGSGNDAIVGYASDDVLMGYGGNDTLSGRAGNDTLYGGNDNDTLNGEDGGDILYGEAGADSLKGGAGADTLYGGADGDNLQGGDGSDTLDGGTGNDVLIGNYYDGYWNTYNGVGNDTYLFGRGDGQDTIYDNDTTAGNLDKLIFKAGVLPSDVAASRSGSDLILKINGTTDQVTVKSYFTSDAAGGWTVEEIRFTDDAASVWNVAYVKTAVLSGGSGNDTLVGYASNDVMSGNDGNDTMSGGDGNDTLNGGADADSLKGENGNDTLNGGDGADYMQGGAGSDVFDGGTGNDTLIGNYYDGYWNTYNGVGSDTYLFGRGDGQDTLYDYDTTSGIIDRLVFKPGIAAEDVQVTASGNHLILKVTGTTDQITLANYLSGDGAGGWAIENISFSDGTVWDVTTVQAMLATNVQNGTAAGDTLTGTAGSDRLLGGEGDDVLSGGAGNDWLDAGSGTDNMSGGTGNDVYVVDSMSDAVAENAGEGNDTVRSSVSWTLGSEVENLVLTGNSTIDGIGNALGNRIFGNSADNRIDGGAGADVMVGGAGKDTYVIDSASDIVIENAAEGVDQVESSIAYTLGSNLENLVLTGSAAINGTGNELANMLTGNSAANILSGGLGNDTYGLYRGAGMDTVQENDATAGNTDAAQFDAGIAADQLWFRQVGNNLEVSIIGTSDTFAIKDWYLGNQYHVEQFKTSDGKTLLDSQVQNLVQAMASFSPPAAGQTTLPESYSASLTPVIAANWQ